MNLTELEEILKATGYPVAYSHFRNEKEPPFICYREIETDNFIADNRVYKKKVSVDIELYMKKKDSNVEQKIEAILLENEISWNSYETYIDTESVFQKVYSITLI